MTIITLILQSTPPGKKQIKPLFGAQETWHFSDPIPFLCVAALVPLRTSQMTRYLWKCFYTPVFLSFLSVLFQTPSFTSPLSSNLSFHQPFTFNYGLHLHLIKTFCLHLSRSTPLRKTFTIDHYLRIEYFQHRVLGVYE